MIIQSSSMNLWIPKKWRWNTPKNSENVTLINRKQKYLSNHNRKKTIGTWTNSSPMRRWISSMSICGRATLHIWRVSTSLISFSSQLSSRRVRRDLWWWIIYSDSIKTINLQSVIPAQVHDVQNDSIKNFFNEIYEIYIKTVLNPFYTIDSKIKSPQFQKKVEVAGKKYLCNWKSAREKLFKDSNKSSDKLIIFKEKPHKNGFYSVKSSRYLA